MNIEKPLLAMSLPLHLSNLTDREAIADAIYRAVIGADSNDQELFDSAFVPDAEFEMNGQSIKGLANVHEGMFSRIAPMDTHHLVLNLRIEVTKGANTAAATAYSQNQHFKPGQGLTDGAKQLMSGGKYAMTFVKDVEGHWRMNKWSFATIWRQGDRSVMA